jgi:preprotein translocase subunit YajC
MRLNKYMLLAGLLIAPTGFAAHAAVPAAAQAETPKAGDTIYDSTGATMGTVDVVTPQAVVINTGTIKVPVPPTAFGKNDKGFHMAMTKAELEAAGQKAQADAQAGIKAAMVAGAQVKDRTGAAVIGTIKETDDQFVTLTTEGGKDVKLPLAAVGMTEAGMVVGMTADEFNAAIAGK